VELTLSGYQELAEKATARLIQQHSPSGRRIGFMMIASIFIEAWDLYSISFLLVSTKVQPSMTGIIRSSTITSGVVTSRQSRASLPLRATMTE
jgi:hypothetical protein